MAKRLSLKQLRAYARAHNDAKLTKRLKTIAKDKANQSSVNKTFTEFDLPDGPFSPIFKNISGDLLQLVESAFAIKGYGYWYNKVPEVSEGHYAQRGIPKAYKKFASDRVEQMQNFDGLDDFFDFRYNIESIDDKTKINGMNKEKLLSLLSRYSMEGDISTLSGMEDIGNAILEADIYDDFDL